MSMPQVECIHGSRSRSDPFLDRVVPKLSTYPPFTPAIGLFFHFYSPPNRFEDEMALFHTGGDGIIISFHLENTEIIQTHNPSKFPIHSAEKNGGGSMPAAPFMEPTTATEATFISPMTHTRTKLSSERALPALRGLVTPERTPEKPAIHAFDGNSRSLSPAMEWTPYFKSHKMGPSFQTPPTSFQTPPASGMPPTPLQTPSPILRSRALDDFSTVKPSSSGKKQFTMTQVINIAPDTQQPITISTTPDFEEYFDLEIIDHEKHASTELEGSRPAQHFSSDEKIADDQKNTHPNLKPEKLIRKLPDWSLSDCNTIYDLKQYLSHKVHSVNVHIVPDNGIVKFDMEEWILSYNTPTLECHQCVITIHAYAEELEDHKLFFACNDIDPPRSLDNEYKVGEETGIFLGTYFGLCNTAQTDIVPSPQETFKWVVDNNVNYKPAEVFFYLYEFRNAMDVRQAKPLLQVGIVDSGSGTSQCANLFKAPFNAPIFGFITTIDSSGNKIPRQIGLGVARPISRVVPKKKDPDPTNLNDWSYTDEIPAWLRDEEMVAKMYQPSVAEPIAAAAGPNLIGLSNLQRWGLSLHPTDGLIPVSA